MKTRAGHTHLYARQKSVGKICKSIVTREVMNFLESVMSLCGVRKKIFMSGVVLLPQTFNKKSENQQPLHLSVFHQDYLRGRGSTTEYKIQTLKNLQTLYMRDSVSLPESVNRILRIGRLIMVHKGLQITPLELHYGRKPRKGKKGGLTERKGKLAVKG